MKKQMFQIGDKASLTMKATDDRIHKIAEVSEDYNPIHLNDTYAAKSFFKKRIAHGLFCMGMVSNVVGNQLPGEGSIFMNEIANYKRPVYVNDEITCEVAVVEIQNKGNILLNFVCKNQEGKTVMDGSTMVRILEQ